CNIITRRQRAALPVATCREGRARTAVATGPCFANVGGSGGDRDVHWTRHLASPTQGLEGNNDREPRAPFLCRAGRSAAARALGKARSATEEFRHVKFSAAFVPGAEALVYTSGSALRSDVSGPGYWVFAPAELATGGIVVVNRGFVPEGRQDP